MDSKLLFAFLITLIAGLSTVIGGLVVLFNKSNKLSWLSFSMSFAAGVMIYVSLVEIIPGSFEMFQEKSESLYIKSPYLNLFIFFALGCLIAIIIEKLMPDQQISKQIGKNFASKKKIYRSGLLIALSLAIHNFPRN